MTVEPITDERREKVKAVLAKYDGDERYNDDDIVISLKGYEARLVEEEKQVAFLMEIIQGYEKQTASVWRPIEEASTIVADNYTSVIAGFLVNGKWRWIQFLQLAEAKETATHWLPMDYLPPPPKQEE